MAFDLATRLAERRAAHLFRQRPLLEGPQGPEVRVDGQSLLAFCSNDYLGLANHPEVIAALRAGADDRQMAETAARARAAGARVIYSAAPFEIEALRAVLPHVSILAVNEVEARDTFAAFGESLPIEGILITRGPKGAEYRDLKTSQIWQQPAFRVQAVDTTGAGDCFAGWFAAGLSRGEDPQTALRHASAAAAIQVTRKGAGDAMPDRAEVMAFLKERG